MSKKSWYLLGILAVLVGIGLGLDGIFNTHNDAEGLWCIFILLVGILCFSGPVRK